MESARGVRRLGHLPALDGLRGIAVLLVVLAHVGSPFIGQGAGDVGVTVFFTLSGFLICTLLCEELESTGHVSLRRFYERRARRLLPALLVVVVTVAATSAATGVHLATWAELLGALFFCTNIIGLFVPVPGAGSILHHTWSLVIEEQFYLVWPWLLVVLWRRRRLMLALILAGAVIPAYQRFALIGSGDNEHLQFSIDTRVDAIFIGCGLALLLRGRIQGSRTAWGGPGLICVGVFALLPFQGVTFLVGLTSVSLATAAIITAAVAGNTPRWLELGPLRAVGQMSYGLYLWHHVVQNVLNRALGPGDHWVTMALVMLPASAGLTWLSWRYIERPFMKGRSIAEPATLAALGGR